MLVDCRLDAGSVTRHVANGGEASLQHIARLGQAIDGETAFRPHDEVHEAVGIAHQVDVSINQPWHEHTTVRVDN